MIKLFDPQGSVLLCASVPLTNTVSAHSPVITIASVSLTAATVALTAFTSLVTSFSSAAILTSMPLAANGAGGTAAGANGLSPSVWDVVSFCQFIAMSGSLNLDYPELLQQWTQNFGWSMGLVQAEGWNRAIQGLRARTWKTVGDSSETNENSQENSAPVVKQSFSLSPNGSSNGSGDRILLSESIGDASTYHFADGPSTKTTNLSMESMVDGAVKSLVEQQQAAGLRDPQNKTQENQILAMAKTMEPAKLLSILSKHDAHRSTIEKRQDPASPAAAPPVSPPPPATPPPVQGNGLLPSEQDMSLMHRFEELAKLHAYEPSPSLTPSPPSSATPTESPSAPLAWPQGNYHPTTEPLSAHGGLASFGQRLNIPAQNLFMTALMLFCLLLLSASLLALVFRLGLQGYTKYFRPGKFTKLRRRFSSYYLGNMLRVVLLGYFAVATLAFYQLTRRDSWVIQTLAATTLLGFVILATWVTLRLRRAGGTSLFFDERLKARYGVLYDQYVVSAYWFFIPVLVYQALKAAIVGFGQGSSSTSNSTQETDAWAQTSLLLLVELVFAALMIWKHPFANKTPNRLNAVLGCVRVLNVVLLAVLIQGTGKISMVSKTVIGVLIMAMQVVMMLVLATLVGVQLSKALWGLLKAIKINRESKIKKEKHEALATSHKIRSSKSEKDGFVDSDDNSDDEHCVKVGRTAGEHTREGGDQSMASLVGMMGIGSNPTIRCTPASDDEDSEDESEDEWNQDRQSLTHTKRASLEKRSSIRDSTQSTDSHSSHILDYYHPAYLPGSHQANQGSKEEYDQDQAGIPVSEVYVNHRLSIPVSESSPTVPSYTWVQSQYMTRRRSESSAMDPTNSSVDDLGLHYHHPSRPFSQLEQDQERGRARPVGAAGGKAYKRAHEPVTFMAPALHGPGFNQVGGSSSNFTARSERRGSMASQSQSYRTLQRESMPYFQSTLLPATLMEGPPPPSTMQPRRTSVSSITLATPRSLSPVLRIGNTQLQQRPRSGSMQSAAAFSPTQVCSSSGSSPSPQRESTGLLSASSVNSQDGSPFPVIPVRSSTGSNLRNNFSQYRFPDERPSSVPDEPSIATGGEAARARAMAPSRRTVADVQRTIHPLSPFHPDYQHPDDLYKPSMPSPNEMGPTGGFTPPNAIQDGSMGSRRDQRAHASISYASTKAPASSAPYSKRLAPKLRIDTRRQEAAPPPQIPMPTLPPTPLSTSMFLPDFEHSRATSQLQEDIHLTKDKQFPAGATNSTTVTLATPQSSNLVQCSLLTTAGNGANSTGTVSSVGLPSPGRQRALTTTLLSFPGRPLTVSRNHRP